MLLGYDAQGTLLRSTVFPDCALHDNTLSGRWKGSPFFLDLRHFLPDARVNGQARSVSPDEAMVVLSPKGTALGQFVDRDNKPLVVRFISEDSPMVLGQNLVTGRKSRFRLPAR